MNKITPFMAFKRFSVTFFIAGSLLVSARAQVDRFTCDHITNILVDVPHIVAGTAANTEYTTTVTVSNPSEIPLTIGVFTQWDGSLSREHEELALEPAATRTLEFSLAPGEALQAGWLQIESEAPVTVVAHILGRATDGRNIAEVSVPGVQARSKFAFPVFRNDPLADNTGIAIVSQLGGLIRADLRDLDGNLIATRELVAASESCAPNQDPFIPAPICSSPPDFYFRYAVMLQELFADLPTDLRRGLVTVEHTSYLGADDTHFGPQYPFGISVIALYTSGLDLRSAPAMPVDIPVRFEVSVPQTVDVEELVAQYNLALVREVPDGAVSILYVDARVANAQVLAENPTVRHVCYNPSELEALVP